MASDWYDEWAGYHTRAFGLGDEEALTVLAWRERFVVSGYTADELWEATNFLISNPASLGGELRYQGRMVAHLFALQTRIRDRRAVYPAQGRPEEDERGTCTRCGGSGRVVVPHPAGVVEGQWRPLKVARGGPAYYTAAVICSCSLGRWLINSGRVRAKGRDGELRDTMSLETYERMNPRWQVQLAARHQQQLRLADLDYQEQPRNAHQQKVRQKLEEVMAALAHQWGLANGRKEYGTSNTPDR